MDLYDDMSEITQALIRSKNMDINMISELEELLTEINKTGIELDKKYNDYQYERQNYNELCYKFSPTNFDPQGLTENDYNILGLDFTYKNKNTKWMLLPEYIEVNTPDLIDKIKYLDIDMNQHKDHYIDKQYKVYVPRSIKPGYILAVKLFNYMKPMSFKSISNWANTWIPPIDILDNVETTELVIEYNGNYRRVGAALIYGDVSYAIHDETTPIEAYNWKTQLTISVQNAFTREYCISLTQNIYNKTIPEIRNYLINQINLENSTVYIDSMIAEVSNYISLGIYNDSSTISKMFGNIPGINLLDALNVAGKATILGTLVNLSLDLPIQELAVIYFLAIVITEYVKFNISSNMIAQIKKLLKKSVCKGLEEVIHKTFSNIDIGTELAIDSLTIFEANLFTKINLDRKSAASFGKDKRATYLQNFKDNVNYVIHNGLN